MDSGSELLLGHGPKELPIKAGTMPRIVNWLIETGDDKYISNFLTAYRQFCEPVDLFKLITDGYDSSAQLPSNDKVEARRSKSVKFLKAWLDMWFMRDFFESGTGYLFNRLLDFLSVMTSGGFSDDSNRCKLIILKNKSQIASRQLLKHQKKRKNSNSPKRGNTGRYDFPVLDPHEIAEQLTLIESEIFFSISPAEFFNLGWKGPQGKKKAPNVNAMVDRFNFVSFWVATEVVMAANVTKRANILKRFINVAEECLELGNYNTMMAILAGMNNVAVTRLKKTWAELHPRSIQTLEDMNTLMENQHNYKAYREHLNNSKGAVVPYLGIFLRDLTFVEEGNMDHLPGGLDEKGEPTKLVNFEKIQLLGTVIQEVARYQQRSYAHLKSNDGLKKYLVTLTRLDEEALYRQSLNVEARSAEADGALNK